MTNAIIKVSKKLNKIANYIDNALERIANKRVGFLLIVFTDDRASYVSNCERESSIKELKRLIELWENGMPNIKAHEIM